MTLSDLLLGIALAAFAAAAYFWFSPCKGEKDRNTQEAKHR